MKAEYQPWEVAALPSEIARQIRTFLRLEEDAPIPLAIWKTFTDFGAEPSGEYMTEPISESVVKWLIQLADLKYPTGDEIAIKPGTAVHSALYNRMGIYVRPAALGRALINIHGNFHAVPVHDLTVDEALVEKPEPDEKPAKARKRELAEAAS